MKKTSAKTPADSAVESRYVLMPEHANPAGTAFGGQIIAWIDMVAAMAAQRHAATEVVTVSIDTLQFRSPINIGNHVLLQAAVNYVGNTSMEVGVKVTAEDPYTGKKNVATTAHLTFVALDKNKKPTPVPPLNPQTPDEKRRCKAAQKRVSARKHATGK